MTVRIRVARSELMSSTPTLAKIAVSAANTADNTAQACQDEKEIGLICGGPCWHVIPGRAKREPGISKLWREIRVRCCAPPRNDAGASVPIFRQHREGGDLDAFVDQRARLFRRGVAVDRSVLDLAIMHLARFVGEALADIVGVLDDVVAQFLQL